ncbi:MAG: hypothetical protein ACRDZ5_11520 [Acidimicrobiales bacterium]
MTKQQQIAAFLGTHVTWPRATGGLGFWDFEPQWLQPAYGLVDAPRPSVDELAHELLDVAEFQALQLGTWLGTTDGKLIAEAVELVTPPFYRQDVELLVAGLQRAAQLQQQQGQQAAGRNALVAIGVAAAVALIIAALGDAG